MAAFLIHLEIYVIIINSLPIPSLDGYGVIQPWLPNEMQARRESLVNMESYFYLWCCGLLHQ